MFDVRMVIKVLLIFGHNDAVKLTMRARLRHKYMQVMACHASPKTERITFKYRIALKDRARCGC